MTVEIAIESTNPSFPFQSLGECMKLLKCKPSRQIRGQRSPEQNNGIMAGGLRTDF